MDDNKKPLRFALLTPITIQPNEPNSWSITTQYITQVLQKHCGKVFPIGPISLRGEVLAGKILNKVTLTLLKKRFLYCDSSHIAKRYARVAAQRLAGLSADVIIAPDCASEIAFLETDIPIVLIEGGTFALWRNKPSYLNLLKRSSYEANMLQELALKKASLILNPSEWAARSVIEDYHTDPQKVHVLPYGANIDNPSPLEFVQKKKKSDRCRLLFVGVDWQGKGGDIAFETLLKLEEMGIRAELIVCGCVPPGKFSHERITVIPYLNKNDERQHKEMENLFMTADFFLLPTREELFGIVFCEASAFGLPIITTNTGGISGAVKDGENGFMLPLSADGSEYAEVIAKIYRDDERYAEMVRASRAAFEQRLNWDTWAITFRKLLAEMFEGKKDFEEETVV